MVEPQFNPVGPAVEVLASDGLADRVKALTSAAAVEGLFGGRAAPSALLEFDAADAPAYFDGLLATVPGAVWIDAFGVLRCTDWGIGDPRWTFGAEKIVHGSATVTRAAREAVIRYVDVELRHRHPRLHCAEVTALWDGPTLAQIAGGDAKWCTVSTIESALGGLSDWRFVGEPYIQRPTPGNHELIVDGATTFYTIAVGVADELCSSLQVTARRYWAQDVEVQYKATMDFGFGSGRATERGALSADFDAGAWENPPPKTLSMMLPGDGASPVPPEPSPTPLPDSYLDWFTTTPPAVIDAAGRMLVARAVRRVAAARRRTQVRFVMPFDPRPQIGDVVAMAVPHLAATGQVFGLRYALNVDGDAGAVCEVILACPAGSGEATGSGAVMSATRLPVSHALETPPLLNHVGKHVTTPEEVEDAGDRYGFLYNAEERCLRYVAARPGFSEQFRVGMPEVPAVVRDPVTFGGSVTATWSIAAGQVAATA